VVACVLGGVLSDAIIRRSGNRRWGRRVVGIAGLSTAGAAVLSTIWVDNTIVLALLLALTFFGNDLSMGPAWAAASDIGERYAGTLAGAMNMIASRVSSRRFAGARGVGVARLTGVEVLIAIMPPYFQSD
jgi:hypothetical protein